MADDRTMEVDDQAGQGMTTHEALVALVGELRRHHRGNDWQKILAALAIAGAFLVWAMNQASRVAVLEDRLASLTQQAQRAAGDGERIVVLEQRIVALAAKVDELPNRLRTELRGELRASTHP